MSNSLFLLGSLLLCLSFLILSIKYLATPKLPVSIYQRIISWWLMIAIVLAAAQFEWTLIFLIAFVICCCLSELWQISCQAESNQRVRNQRVFDESLGRPLQANSVPSYHLTPAFNLLLIYCLVLCLEFAIHAQSLLLIFVFILPLGYLLLVRSQRSEVKKRLLFLLASGVFIIGLSVPNIILGVTAGLLLEGAAGNLLFFVLISQGNDVAQYCWGKALGGRKIVATISPNKTWAGFIGGLLTMSVIGYGLGSALTLLSPLQSIVAAMLICVLGFGGDISVSYLKRQYQVKDMGTLLPGHGGMADRVDSLLYSGAGFLLFLVIFSTGSLS